LNVGHKSPPETIAEAFFHTLQLVRILVRCEDDLTTAFIESIENMKNFFLCALAAA